MTQVVTVFAFCLRTAIVNNLTAYRPRGGRVLRGGRENSCRLNPEKPTHTEIEHGAIYMKQQGGLGKYIVIYFTAIYVLSKYMAILHTAM